MQQETGKAKIHPQVAVIGPGEASEGEQETARETGRFLGSQGAVLLCGGRGGVMRPLAGELLKREGRPSEFSPTPVTAIRISPL